MKSVLLLISLTLLHFSSFSQHWEIDKYEVDSLKIYSPTKTSYTFYIDAGTQGLFVNRAKVVWLPAMEVKIVNNTNKPIVNNFRERDGHLMWYRIKWNDTIQPGEEMILVSKWPSRGASRLPFSKHIYFDYTLDSTKHKFVIKTWGMFFIDIEEQKRIIAKKEPVLVSKPKPIKKVKKVTIPYVVQNSNPPPQVKKKRTDIVEAPLIVRTYAPIQIKKKKSYYQGERVNQRNRKGFREGKWITLYDDNKVKSREFFPGIDYHWDSAYFYYESSGRLERKLYHVKLSDSAIKKQEYNDQGVLFKTYLWNGTEIIEPERKLYFSSGKIRREFYPYPNKRVLDYYESGAIQKCSTYTLEAKVDTIKYYYESGTLQKIEILNVWEKPQRRFTYDEDGDLLIDENVYRRRKISLKYISKTDSLFVVERYYNGKFSWTDRGVYRDNKLWEGTRLSGPGTVYSLPTVFIKGRKNGFYFEDEWVNRSDSLRQHGKWLTFYKSGVIKNLSMFTNGVRDSIYRYYESGVLQSIHYSRGDFSQSRRQTKKYFENGAIQHEQGGFLGDTISVSYYNSGEIDKMKTRNGYQYDFEKGNNCSYKITRPKIKEMTSRSEMDIYTRDVFGEPQGYGPIEDFYKNCKHYKRITSRFYYVSGIEGKEYRSNNYKIEKGSFTDDSLHNGIREYYDSNKKYIRTVKVRNGKEL